MDVLFICTTVYRNYIEGCWLEAKRWENDVYISKMLTGCIMLCILVVTDVTKIITTKRSDKNDNSSDL